MGEGEGVCVGGEGGVVTRSKLKCLKRKASQSGQQI